MYFPIKYNINFLKKTSILSLLLALVLGFAATALANTPAPVKIEPLQTSQAFSKQLKDAYGIELTALRLTASGHMIDFRYRVVDAKKASPLFERQTKPYLIHKKSGKVLAVPTTAKVGSLRNSNTPQEGRIYWMFFGNQRLVQSGDLVSVVIGDFRADDLTVE